MGRGEITRQAILEHAAELASQIGLEGLTIGRLAEDLGLSKSGLFAHFQSKEELQLHVVDFAAARFVETVVRPALGTPRGEPRLRALFDLWRRWAERGPRSAGCFFVAAATELDDRPGRVRDRLVDLQKDWLETVATVVRTAVAQGHFDAKVDADQLAHEIYGVMLAHHHAARLLRDPHAEARTTRAFESLLAHSRIRSA